MSESFVIQVPRLGNFATQQGGTKSSVIRLQNALLREEDNAPSRSTSAEKEEEEEEDAPNRPSIHTEEFIHKSICQRGLGL